MKEKVTACNEGSVGGNTSPILSLTTFCRGVGISTVTAWRWRRNGWLQTINIGGRHYIASEAAAQFKSRAEAGEFAKTATMPKRVQSKLP